MNKAGKSVGVILVTTDENYQKMHNLLVNTTAKILFEYKIYTGRFRTFYLLQYFVVSFFAFCLKIKIKCSNILFFTELELSNHIFVRALRSNSTSVFLLEDGGLASYLLLCKPRRVYKVPLKSKLKMFILKMNPYLFRSEPFKLNNQIFFQLKDREITSFLQQIR